MDLSKTAFSSIGKLTKGKILGSALPLGSVSKTYTKAYLDTEMFHNLGVELAVGVPNSYLKDETIHIRGKELLGKDTVLLFLLSPSGKEISFAMKKSADGTFDLGISLGEVGNYRMVVASGLGFDTNKFADLVVLDDKLFASKKLLPATVASPLASIVTERIESSDRQ